MQPFLCLYIYTNYLVGGNGQSKFYITDKAGMYDQLVNKTR